MRMHEGIARFGPFILKEPRNGHSALNVFSAWIAKLLMKVGET
jgi:hypothetical protein